MRIQWLSPDDRRWDEVVARFPAADAYFSARYHRAQAGEGQAQAVGFYAERGRDAMFYPFLLRTLDPYGLERTARGRVDIETVYGYTGPLSTSLEETFLSLAWERFDAWCGAHGVVSEFVRYNPLIESQLAATPRHVVRVDRQTVLLDLAGGEEALWHQSSDKERNRIRKALKSCLDFEPNLPDEALSDFEALYESTMVRVGAGPDYFFSPRYFRELLNGEAGVARLMGVRLGADLVAAGLFLSHGDRLHLHLLGHDFAYQALRPTSLLVHEAARWAQSRGYRWLHLGGGRTAAPDDSLLRFKAGFSPHRRPFYVGHRIHDADLYARLCGRWQRLSGQATPTSYFPPYRLEIAPPRASA